MVNYYIYTGRGSKIYNSRTLTVARLRAKLLSKLKSSGSQAFITTKNLSNVIESYVNGKRFSSR